MPTSPAPAFVNQLRLGRFGAVARAVLAGSAMACASNPALAQLTISRQFAVEQAVPDGGALADVRTIAVGAASIADVQVSLRLSGGSGRAFNGDLFAAVGHDDRLAVLLNRPGRRSGSTYGYGDSGLDVTFSDDATRDIHNYRAELSGNHNTRLAGPVSGIWKPDGRAVDPGVVLDSSPRTANLSTFQGRAVDGEWRLLLADVSAGGQAILHGWGLQIRTTAAPTGDLTFNGDTIQGGGTVNEFLNHVVLSSQNLVSGPTDLKFLGSITGAGTLEQRGSGVLTLGAANSFTGGVKVESGILAVGHDEALGTGTLVLSGGALQSTGGARTLANAVQIAGGGTVDGPAPVRFDGPTGVAGASTLNVATTVTIAGALTDDHAPGTKLTKVGTGTLVITGEHVFSAPTFVQQGILKVQGQIPGSAVTVEDGGILSGSGTVGSLSVRSGGTISPGNSPGTGNVAGDVEWGVGGSYEWEINKALGTAGTDPGWDLISAAGELRITATAVNPFTIQIKSRLLPSNSNTAGAVGDFNSGLSYTWTIATAAGGVTGFDAAKFLLDTSGFQNPLGGGSFSINRSGNSIQVGFNAVPEPGEWLMFTGLALVGLALMRRAS